MSALSSTRMAFAATLLFGGIAAASLATSTTEANAQSASSAVRGERPSAEKARATAQIRAAAARSKNNKAFIAAKRSGDMATIAKILTANGAPKGIVVENGGGGPAGKIIIIIKCKCWGGDFDIRIEI